ncbi:fatty acid-binding protein homolog 9 [Lingula anatina]|uniref:Fatty acid-binding protein homolog 9 n=1 Tax=Lingula anatina TaxID=7574 RepID=A0A1S3JX95_LINAN|nr:fatty acid-binding protein homolog 9 [Lingula anatina]|eukprot:XP_013414932.1 fatty acid-binding protein homolog 9 [Lingula anatina]
MTQFLGKWNFVSVENLDVFMDSLGTKPEVREFMQNTNPDMEYSQEGDEWVMTIHIPGSTKVTKFKLGEPFDNTTLDGMPVKSTVTLKDNKLSETYSADNGKVDLTREVNGNQLISIAWHNDVKCTWIHNKA